MIKNYRDVAKEINNNINDTVNNSISKIIQKQNDNNEIVSVINKARSGSSPDVLSSMVLLTEGIIQVNNISCARSLEELTPHIIAEGNRLQTQYEASLNIDNKA